MIELGISKYIVHIRDISLHFHTTFTYKSIIHRTSVNKIIERDLIVTRCFFPSLLIKISYSRFISSNTAWPKSKFEMSFGYNSETMHFWPNVGKAKMRLRGVQFFLFSAVCLQFSAVCLQFFKKIGRLSNTFWLYQHGVRNA